MLGLTASQIAMRTGKSKRTVNDAFNSLRKQNLATKAGYRRDRADVWIALDA